ncbi:hypothetical protein BCR42DRAFT_457481 [Absidia repens]|uniref:Heterokaryon incompatibility domain-containing protein n=1 Tax=Absidia repens TaxID=90262 RepID=A0A1X2HKC9_9FUNG|nr:hypothetical protein BCR42DRAFT_457481 [Absidia repens]
MTTDDPVDQLGKDLSLNDTQQQLQKKPFQVVLIDIEKAANNKVIHCVKKPLEEEDLKFVALSYRLGELHETLIDTGIGYTASITSFHLNDFYQLCFMMTSESELKHIKYVWVDAICVDQRPTKRKATIYQMNNIYDRAAYILAVPDLHLAYLRGISIKNDDAIEGSTKYSNDIYHLIHQNRDQIVKAEEGFLNDAQVPKEPPELRQLLLEFTDHFAYSFMYHERHQKLYCPVQALDHICETTQAHRHHWQTWTKRHSNRVFGLHSCHDPICPIELVRSYNLHSGTEKDEWQVSASQWKSKVIHRSTAIRQSMEFLTDLVKDWSSRVWVVSEYNIAKKKNNLKYWFIQLASTHDDNIVFRCLNEEFTFFKFDLDDDTFPDLTMMQYYKENQHQSRIDRLRSTNPVYKRFHYTLIRHLNQQTFLEMLLRSKASRNEDRFYSILPLSKYADKITEVSRWGIHSMLSVKLKLYDIMNIEDKLILLLWSSNKDAIIHGILPTFATSTLPLDFNGRQLLHLAYKGYFNFDLYNPFSIMLHHHYQQTHDQRKGDEDDDGDGDSTRYYYLRIKPKEYYVQTDNSQSRIDLLTKHIPVLQRLGIYHASSSTLTTLDIVSIPAFQWDSLAMAPKNKDKYVSFFFILVGCFAQNKWIISSKHDITYPYAGTGSLLCGNDHKDPKSLSFFDIY